VNIRVDATAIVNSVAVAPTTASVNVGATTQLTATVTVGNNASTAVTWSTSNAANATVDQTGKVTGVAAGTAVIRATAQADATKFAEATITVTGSSFPSIAEVIAGADATFQPGTVEIAIGGTVTWTFQALAHNVTFAATTGAPSNIGNNSNTQVSRTFNTLGTFVYDCTLHGGMTGRVIVH
jgi:plastocyanin